MRTCWLLITLFLFAFRAVASESTVYATEEDHQIFNRYLQYIADKQQTPQTAILATADFFLDVPYVGATLEKEPEGLVVNLRELDCTTFVETVYSLSKTVINGKLTFDAFCDNLRNFRYRGGTIAGYISRLHYTTDWIYDNGEQGLMKDVTREAGGEQAAVSLSFMSSNADKYKQLKDNPAFVEAMVAIEKEVNSRSYYCIPEGQIDACSKNIQDGDMVCFVTTIAGLDISHVGIARWVAGKLTFIHASSSFKKVIVEPRTMQEYTQAISKNKGVMIIRPTFF